MERGSLAKSFIAVSSWAGNGDDCGCSWCCLPCFSGSTFSENPVRFHSSTPFKVRL